MSYTWKRFIGGVEVKRGDVDASCIYGGDMAGNAKVALSDHPLTRTTTLGQTIKTYLDKDDPLRQAGLEAADLSLEDSYIVLQIPPENAEPLEDRSYAYIYEYRRKES